MAKKSKRQVRKSTAVSRSTPTPPVTHGASRSFDREFNPDYTPVISDLRRIGILAGSFFMILVVLSFFLR